MTIEDLVASNRLLALKASAYQGIPWTSDDESFVRRLLEQDDTIGVLAACCVLSAGRVQLKERALQLIRMEIARQESLPYVEVLLYEALIMLDIRVLSSVMDQLLAFIKRTLERRAIDLCNTVVLLGNIARVGDARALPLLRTLAEDVERDVRENAKLILNGLHQ